MKDCKILENFSINLSQLFKKSINYMQKFGSGRKKLSTLITIDSNG